MAIKKGAFDLYTQERQLPNKKTVATNKNNHFFDDVNKTLIGSDLPQRQLTITDANFIDEINVGANKTHSDIISNGSQTVHNGFTSHTIDPLNSQVKQTETIPTELNASMEKLPKISFSRLVGNQREIIIALYKNMKINKSDATGELTLESISKLAGVNQKSLKNTLFRLSNAGLIFRSDQKIGRGGWVKYKVNPHIIREIQEKEFFRY